MPFFSDILEKTTGSSWNRYLDSSSNIAAVILDNQKTIIASNQGFITLLGLALSPIGKNISEFIASESLEELVTQQNAKTMENKVLSFISAGQSPVLISTSIFATTNNIVLFGDRIIISNNTALQQMSLLNNELSNMARALKQRNKELEDARKELKQLKGMLPICSYCKKIRDDNGNWIQIEQYIHDHSSTVFSHSVCPDCYPEVIRKASM